MSSTVASSCRRRKVAALAIAAVALVLGGTLGVLGYLAWASEPTIPRALLFGAPPLLVLTLAVSVAIEGLLPP